jgi:AcrR family transcriptional regulator
MPPKTLFEKNDIIQAALKLLQEKGIQELTARKIAGKLNTSVAPIYGLFTSIENLKREVLIEIKNMILEYCRKSYTAFESLNCGVGFILFARDYPKHFRVMFLDNAEYKDIIGNLSISLREVIFSLQKFKGVKKNKIESISANLWYYSYGMAVLACTGLLEDNSDKYIINKLSEVATTEFQNVINSK